MKYHYVTQKRLSPPDNYVKCFYTRFYSYLSPARFHYWADIHASCDMYDMYEGMRCTWHVYTNGLYTNGLTDVGREFRGMNTLRKRSLSPTIFEFGVKGIALFDGVLLRDAYMHKHPHSRMPAHPRDHRSLT